MLTMLDFICSLHRNHQDGKEGGQMTLQKRKRKGEWTSIVCNLLVNNFLIKCSQSNHGIQLTFALFRTLDIELVDKHNIHLIVVQQICKDDVLGHLAIIEPLEFAMLICYNITVTVANGKFETL